MKRIVLLATVVLATTGLPAFSQTTGGAKSQPPSDEIVHMRQEIAAARKTYNDKVAEAKKVFDEAKTAAAKERDAAISAARSAVNQKKS